MTNERLFPASQTLTTHIQNCFHDNQVLLLVTTSRKMNFNFSSYSTLLRHSHPKRILSFFSQVKCMQTRNKNKTKKKKIKANKNKPNKQNHANLVAEQSQPPWRRRSDVHVGNRAHATPGWRWRHVAVDSPGDGWQARCFLSPVSCLHYVRFLCIV